MATTKVSALPAKTSLGGSEELLINDSGTSKKVTATNLLSGATVADGSISTAKIADDAVTEAKLANAINTAIAANTAKTSNATHTGDVTGATTLTIAANAVTTAKILDDNVTADKLANSINTDIATGVTANTTANAALPKSGGAMTGNLTSSAEIRIGTTQEFDSLNGRGNLVVGSGSGNEGMTIYSGASNQGGIIFADGVSSADAYEGQIQYDHSDDSMRFSVNDGTEKMRIKSTGATEFTNSVTTGTDTDTSNTGSVTLDFAANQNFVLTLTGNVTLANPSTEQVGQSGFITFIQDGTGSRTVGLGTDYETAGGAGLTLTSTASATDIVPYVVVASGRILLGTPQLAFA